VLNVRQVGDDFEVLLAEGVSPQTLLKRLVAADAVVTKFELVEPSLHDIFIAKVKETS
jgi:ABC-2 type transport system ATP-binding protein